MTYLQKEALKGLGWLVVYLLVVLLPALYLIHLIVTVLTELAT